MGEPGELVLDDGPARHRIETDLQTTIFVEAGAGSGKTERLVKRVLALVLDGQVALEHIAAITFTDKAAAELRERIRSALEDRLADETLATPKARRYEEALDQLDAAAIGTLHSFARRLLSEHPVEAALPPRIDVLDEVSSEVAFEERWSESVEWLLGDQIAARLVLLLDAAGVTLDHLRAVARSFEENWDLVEERVEATKELSVPLVDAEVKEAAAHLRRLCAGARCTDPADTLRRRLDALATVCSSLDQAADSVELVGIIVERERVLTCGRLGRKENWPGVDLPGLRQEVSGACERLKEARRRAALGAVQELGKAIAWFTLEGSARRQAEGRLVYHDLLVLARKLLCRPPHGPEVRAALHDRYECLLLDEFQDTDPIQIELAVRIAATHPASPEAGEAPWQEVPVAPGRLFFVGDPKQSIYRFRRADVGVYLEAAARFADQGARENLTANFRSTEPVVAWINSTFSSLFAELREVAAGPSQVPFVALQATRGAPPSGPGVTLLGRRALRDGSAADLRRAEAQAVAATVWRAVAEGWSVGDPQGGWRPATFADITILLPSRTSLPFIEDALDEANVAYRAEASSLVYASSAVRDVLMVLRAVADPSNELHTVAALRTPLLGCGDDELFSFRREPGRSWNYLAPGLDEVPTNDPVGCGLRYLRQLHRCAQERAPSELLSAIVNDRRAMELGFSERRARDVWRRLRYVVDQARLWSESVKGNLRQYLAWVDHQASEGARFADAILPEPDDQAVRIMTVHAAKGLEFPITVLAGMTTEPRGSRGKVRVEFPRDKAEVAYRVGDAESPEYSAFRPIDEQMDVEERKRLLYVACTRARDHLVVSVVRREREARRTPAELLAGVLTDAVDGEDEPDDADPVGSSRPLEARGLGELMPFDKWQEQIEAALEGSSRPKVVAATALSDEGGLDVEPEPEGARDPGPEIRAGLDKRPRDLDLPPWQRGRYGSAVGRAVHGVLQAVDLASGAGLADLAAAQCEAEAVTERQEDVTRLVEAALLSATVREAARSAHWRELFVGTPIGDRLLEGYVDLLYRGPSGLVVVDYKTSSTSEPGELDRRLALYRNQGAAYALAVSEAVGEPVSQVVFVFLTPEGALERAVEELGEAVAHVRELVTSGQEVLEA